MCQFPTGCLFLFNNMININYMKIIYRHILAKFFFDLYGNITHLQSNAKQEVGLH